MVTPMFSTSVACRKCEGDNGEAFEHEKELCDENSKRVYIFGDSLSSGGGCVAAVSGKVQCWWVKFRQCSELLYGKLFPIKVKVVPYIGESGFLLRWKWFPIKVKVVSY